MKRPFGFWYLMPIACCTLAGCGSNPGDRLAWEALVDISRHETSGALAGDTPVGWRLWSTQREVYPTELEPPVPASTGHYDKFRPLDPECQGNVQDRMFGPSVAEQSTHAAPPCVAVFLDDSAAKYIIDNKFYLRHTLAVAAAAKPGIHLPEQGSVAREIKTEWQPIEPFQFGDYIVAIDKKNQPWGLVAVHLMTHARPKWLWATWIHEKYANLVPKDLGLHDSFGTERNGEISCALVRLLVSKKQLFLANYKLIGSQADFKPTRLGNPLIEANLECSSCMGCHQNASLMVNGGWPNPDPCTTMGATTLPAGLNSTDFDYSLASQAKCHHVGGCTDGNLEIHLQ